MPDPANFTTLYQEKLLPAIQLIEPARKTVQAKAYLMDSYILIGVLLFVIITSSREPLLIFFPISVFFFVAAGMVYRKLLFEKTKYIKAYKQTVIAEIIKGIQPSFIYQPAEYVSPGDFDQSELYLDPYDSFTGEDYVEGMQGVTHFCFSELSVLQRNSSGKETPGCVFSGLFFTQVGELSLYSGSSG